MLARYTYNDKIAEGIMRNNIFLIGFMGAGKSTVAHALQEICHMELVEMDERIEACEHMTIQEIFAKKGEDYFRTLETQLLLDMERKQGCIVSCGGGVPMRACNIEAMRRSGRIVYLSARPQTVLERVRDSHTRPLLEGKMNVEYIEALMRERRPEYLAAADITVETDGKCAQEIGEEILQKV